MAAGWIKLHRSLLDWEWFDDSKMVHLFLYLMVSANHENKMWKGRKVKRGQLVIGRRSLAQKIGFSERSIRTCLHRLVMTGELTIETSHMFSVVTINNYSKYQASAIGDRPTAAPQITPPSDPQTDPRGDDSQSDSTACIDMVYPHSNDGGMDGIAPPSDPGNDPQTDHKQELKNRRKRDKVSCPHLDIVNLYNSMLNDKLRSVIPKLWGGSRKMNLTARWGEDCDRQDLEWWKDYFDTVKLSTFLTGENDRGWKADLGWLVKSTNMVKVLEGNYTKEEAAQGSSCSPSGTCNRCESLLHGRCPEKTVRSQACKDYKEGVVL